MKIVVWILLLSTARAAFCDDDQLTSSSHYITGYLGESLLILGSEDDRFGGAFSYGYGRPEPKFRMGIANAQLVYELYIDHTQTSGANGGGPNNTWAGGPLAYGRWRWPIDKAGNGVYFDLGWGLQLASQPTVDLNSELNSTPVMDLGGTFKDGNHEFFLGLRYLHASNAGLKLPNFGQNELYLMLGVRY